MQISKYIVESSRHYFPFESILPNKKFGISTSKIFATKSVSLICMGEELWWGVFGWMSTCTCVRLSVEVRGQLCISFLRCFLEPFRLRQGLWLVWDFFKWASWAFNLMIPGISNAQQLNHFTSLRSTLKEVEQNIQKTAMHDSRFLHA